MEEAETKRKKRTTTLAVDLKELKVPWHVWCVSRGLTPSEAVRQVISAALSASTMEVTPISVNPAQVVRGVRKRLAFSVTETDYERLSRRAGIEGMSVPRWIQALIHVQLTGEAQLSDQEMRAMLESNRAMLALGRNVNQIARQLNAQVGRVPVDLKVFAVIQEEIEAHRGQIRRVLDANRDRWRP